MGTLGWVCPWILPGGGGDRTRVPWGAPPAPCSSPPRRCRPRPRRVLLAVCSSARRRRSWAPLDALDGEEEGEEEPVEWRELARMTGTVVKLIRRRRTTKAFDKLDAMLEEGYALDVTLFNRILAACGSVRLPGAAERLVQTMREVGPPPDARSYELLLCIYCRRGDRTTMELRLRQMEREGVRPTVEVFNALLLATLAARDAAQAKAWMQQMRTAQVRPDVRTHEVLMKLFALRREPPALYDTLRSCKRSGLTPSWRLYSLLLEGLASCDDTGGLEVVLGEMTARGLAPSPRALVAMVGASARRGGHAQVDDLIERLVGGDDDADDAGSSPWHTAAFNAALEGYAATGRLDDVRRWWQRMVLRGVEPDTYTASSLLRTCAKAGGDTAAVHAQFAKLVADGVRPDAVMWGGYLTALCQKDDLDGAGEVFRRVVQDGASPSPNGYNDLLALYVRHGRIAEVKGILRRMTRDRVRPRTGAYTALLCLFARAGRIDDASKLLRVMRSRGVYPEREGIVAMRDEFRRLGRSENADGLQRAYLTGS